jgi:rhodanese-related sulfurtransferase
MTTSVSATPAAGPAAAQKHFASCLAFETDCWDVHESMSAGDPDFVLLDVRSPTLYANGHVAGALNLPHAKITAQALGEYRHETLFVVYCAGPHCNGAHRGALRLADLGRPVKMMIGGVTGWLDEGFELVRSSD